MTSKAASMIELDELPTPDHITLLLKHHKSTVLVSVLPEQSLTTIKGLLLAALGARGISEFPGSTTVLPEDPEDLEFGVLKDKRDPSKGWIPLEIKEQDATDTKGGKRKVGGKKGMLNESPAGDGLGDGSLIAYRIKLAKNEEEDDAMTDVIDDPGWDVVLPSYDDEPAEDEM